MHRLRCAALASAFTVACGRTAEWPSPSRAPFRLIAVASRLDLPTSLDGEGRLIYGLVDAKGNGGLMSVDFEFALPALGTPDDRLAWAQRWHALSGHPFGDGYNGPSIHAVVARWRTWRGAPGTACRKRRSRRSFRHLRCNWCSAFRRSTRTLQVRPRIGV